MRLLVAGFLLCGVVVQSIQLSDPQQCADSYQRSVCEPPRFSLVILSSKRADVSNAGYSNVASKARTVFHAFLTAGLSLSASVP